MNPSSDVPADEIRAHLQVVVNSRMFGASERLQSLLRFCVESVMEGARDGLKEYLLGVEVFRRKSDYDPRTDPIVRVEAHRLRMKLKEYYRTEGRKETVLIEFPKGTYAPVFRRRPTRAKRTRRTAPQSPAAAPAIAVLPFSDLSRQEDQDYFCIGLTEELNHALAQVPGLRVASCCSSPELRKKPWDVRKIGRRLNVTTVLEGSVRRIGNLARVSAHLIDVSTGYHLVSQTYDREIRELKDVLAIQDEIARAVAGALRIELMTRVNAPLVKRETENLQARQLYLKGRYHQERWTAGGGLEKSVEYLQRALAEDPNYARAYSALAESYSLLSFCGFMPPNDVMPAAKAAAERALKIDATLPPAHTALGIVKTLYDWDWAGAAQEFHCSLELEPHNANARYWYAHLLWSLGRLNDATEQVKRACESDPLSVMINLHLATAHFFQRDYRAAISQARKTIHLDPTFGGGYWGLGMAYQQQSRYREAIEALQKAAELSAGNSWVMGALGHCYARSGRREKASQLIEELKKTSEEKHISRISLAFIHIGLGEADRAIEELEQACRDRDGRLIYLNVSPLYDGLRADSRFQQIVSRIGLPQVERVMAASQIS